MINLKVNTGERKFTVEFPNWFKNYSAQDLWQCVENHIVLTEDEYDIDYKKQRKNEKPCGQVINFKNLVDFQVYKNRIRQETTVLKRRRKVGEI